MTAQEDSFEKKPFEKKSPSLFKRRWRFFLFMGGILLSLFLLWKTQYLTPQNSNPLPSSPTTSTISAPLEDRLHTLEESVNTLSANKVDPVALVHLIQEEVKKHASELPQPEKHEHTSVMTRRSLTLESLVLCDILLRTPKNAPAYKSLHQSLRHNVKNIFKGDVDMENLTLDQENIPPPTQQEKSTFPSALAWLGNFIHIQVGEGKQSTSTPISAPAPPPLSLLQEKLGSALLEEIPHE